MRLSHRVAAAEAGLSVERLMHKNLGFSRTMIRRLKRLSGVLVNGQAVYLNRHVQEGDEISISLQSAAHTRVPPQPIPIAVVYEDEHLLAVNKPPGMLVHPLKHEMENTLANAVLYHFEQNAEPVFRPISRLDRNTSGLVLVAKHAYSGYRLARQLGSGEMRREYLAVVHGLLAPESGVIDLPVGRCGDSRIKHMVFPGGKRAVTYYQAEKYLRDGTLVRLRLVTGRTHQIRVHLSHAGHPLMGDTLYGGQVGRIGRQALHCARVDFIHPLTGKELVVEAPPPADMQKLIENEK